jgi:tRNA threonylcarbamoyladenosine modification (KEOPS) complex Cgi121 subunit
MGAFDGIGELGLVVVGSAKPEEIIRQFGLERDDSVLDPAGKDPSVFGIRPTEIEIMGAERVAELVLERVAMSEAWR